MNINEDLTLSPGDEELIIADRRAMRRARGRKPTGWAALIGPDPFMVEGVDTTSPF